MTKPLILLATDFSEEATRAYAPTVSLAKRLGGKLTLIHVVPNLMVIPHGSLLAPPQSEPDLTQKVEFSTQKMQELVETLDQEVEIDYQVLSGERVEKVLSEYAEEHGAEFLALATHGRSGLRRVVMGSVAEAILRQTVTPVIIFPRPQ